MTIKQICETYNISQTELSDRFGIPYRTVQDWYGGRRTPPDYVVGMIEQLLAQEQSMRKSE
ncbi:MAG: helix-turn-helix domain-containing protein [Oscillospiraceae bacterium]|nr:helix-turn-helix domain-containing protein [Oscillospiraceae bacterium]MBR2977624.1 helix-turn-helix domain-containing protein [Oscillospiraceae bacterium]